MLLKYGEGTEDVLLREEVGGRQPSDWLVEKSLTLPWGSGWPHLSRRWELQEAGFVIPIRGIQLCEDTVGALGGPSFLSLQVTEQDRLGAWGVVDGMSATEGIVGLGPWESFPTQSFHESVI